MTMAFTIAFTDLFIMMLKRVTANIITFWWLVWELCQHSFLNISHYHSDYSVTLTSQMINFLCLIPSKWHGLRLFYQHIQLLQHQVSGYAWKYWVISHFFNGGRLYVRLSFDNQKL